jgi:hypothetical protein
VDELWAENLQTCLQSFDLMLDIFFYGGNFMKTVADVNVHERLGLADEVRNQGLSYADCTPGRKKANRRIGSLMITENWPVND